MQNKIIIRGAREHNLKNISLELPRNKMIVFTGLSGSGKSSLAFDTIFAEGQRRYIESLSAYARQFLGGMQKPDVDEIEGLSPAISIDQKAHSANPRSTVATLTEIYDYLRVLYARVGIPHCPECGTKIEKMTTDQMVEWILEKIQNEKIQNTWNNTQRDVKSQKTKQSKPINQFPNKLINQITIFSPIVRGRKGEYYQMLYDMYNSGFLEVRVDGKMKSLRERIVMGKHTKHTIEIVVDRLNTVISNEVRDPLVPEEKSFAKYKTKVLSVPLERDSSPEVQNDSEKTRLAEAVETAVDLSNGLCTVQFADGDEQTFSTMYSCPNDGFSFPEIEPRLFSFNSPYGYCSACTGLGTKELFSMDMCPVCEGKRLNTNALSVKIGEKNIWEVTSHSIGDARAFFDGLIETLSKQDLEIAGTALSEIANRLQFLFDVGLHYITLNRKAGTLSGGEAQRIRLASQVGQKLVGALYVLDEPTIGLHQKDNEMLVSTLRNLCDIGNTIIVVEHDEDTIRASDWVVDIGPGAGRHGGEVVYSGPLDVLLDASTVIPNGVRDPLHVDKLTLAKYSPKALFHPLKRDSSPSVRNDSGATVLNDVLRLGNAKTSLTGQYLRGEKKIPLPEKRRKVDRATPMIKMKGASENNLKHINVEIPLRRFVCLTGVSGSGKSTLMNDILYRSIANKLNHVNKKIGAHKEIKGIEYIDKIIRIDQSPIGRTPRSNPATYTKAYDAIRDLFAETAEARIRGYKKGRFSFNTRGGRCEHCEGRGILTIEMHFLPDVQIVCDVCKGRRFDNETLQVHFKDKNISEILSMTIEDAEEFFQDIPFIYDKLKILNDVGLDYLTLGQSATTLSGGEAQRIKLSRELAKRNTTKTLYLLDEPTTGLHYDDVKKLIEVLQRLVNQGNTVMVIEHNLDLIKCADWIIDLGPDGGDKGGELVAVGTPEDVARRKTVSYTGAYLEKYMSR